MNKKKLYYIFFNIQLILSTIFIIFCLYFLYKYTNSNSKHIYKIRIGVSPDYYPFEYIQNNNLIGIDIDIANAISKYLNKEIEFVQMSFDMIFTSLKNGSIDLAISAISKTDSREKYFDFSYPYYQSKTMIIGSIDKQHSDNKSLKIGVQLGSIFETIAKKYFKDSDILYIADFNMMINYLQFNKIDAIIGDPIILNEIFNHSREKYYIKYIEDIDISEYSIVGIKNSPLMKDVNHAILHLKNTGTLDSIYKQWLLNS